MLPRSCFLVRQMRVALALALLASLSLAAGQNIAPIDLLPFLNDMPAQPGDAHYDDGHPPIMYAGGQRCIPFPVTCPDGKAPFSSTTKEVVPAACCTSLPFSCCLKRWVLTRSLSCLQ